MVVEHRIVTDFDGRQWKEEWRDGTQLEARELLPMRSQPPRTRVEMALPALYGTWKMLDDIVAELTEVQPGTDKLAQLVKRRSLAWQALDQQLVTWLAFGPVELPD